MRLSNFVALVVLAPLVRAQTTWYVDAAGNPPGTGTANDPYTSIAYALAQGSTHHGDLLLVAPGDYPGNLNVSKGVTIRATAGPLVTRIVPTAPGDVVALGHQSDPKSRLEGFTIEKPITGVGSTVYMPRGELAGCLLPDNHGGFGIGVEANVGLVDGCTIVNGRLGIAIGGLGTNDLEVRNTILWNHDEADLDFHHGSLWIHHCVGLGIVNGCCFAENDNVYADPRFWHLETGNLHLAPGSPAIDAGDPNDPPDEDGSVRDAGAIPYDPTYAPPPKNYCTGKLSSEGCIPVIGAEGQASATSTEPFLVTASQTIGGKFGLLFYGFQSTEVPFLGGTRCVRTPIQRTPPQVAADTGNPCGGSYTFDFQSRIQSGIDPGLVPGAIVFCQYWFRDPHDPTGFGTGLTDALRFGIAP